MNAHNDKHPVFERLLNRLAGPFVTIFTLHRPQPESGAFNGASENLLERCLDYATQKNYRFSSLDQLVDDALKSITPTQPTLCFTLDDGYADQASRLLPLLIDYKASPTLFVITDFIDQKLWPWDAQLTYLLWNSPLASCTINIEDKELLLDLSTKENRILARRLVIRTVKLLDPNNHEQHIRAIEEGCQLRLPASIPDEFAPATWQELRTLEAKGVHIGSHTKSHIVFNSSSDSLIEQELRESRVRLHSELASPSSVFCYPLGSHQDFSEHHIQLVKNAGYSSAVSTISNITNMAEIRRQPFQIQRIGFPNNFEKFIRYTSWREAIRSKLPF